MADRQPAPVIRYLKSTLGAETTGPSDTELLSRYIRERDEGAFELLLWRHSGLVLRVCHTILHDPHLAEDAAQATFLVLARKARGLLDGRPIAGWLFTVARRIALRLQQQQKKSHPLSTEPPVDRETSPVDAELAQTIHQEVSRLPDRYRQPVLLCYFEGLTQQDAAQRLGWPLGTVAGRLSRAKELLLQRLQRRGVAVPVAGLTGLLAFDSSQVFSSTSLTTVLQGAHAISMGTSPDITPQVWQLTNGVIKTMLYDQLKTAAAVFAFSGIIVSGLAWTLIPGDNSEIVAQSRPGVGIAKGAPAPMPPSEEIIPDRVADSKQRERSKQNLKQIILAIINYHDTYGHFPQNIVDAQGKALLSWRVAILPFIENDALYRKFRINEPWDSEHNLKLASQMPEVFRVGFEDKSTIHTYYRSFRGPSMFLGMGSQTDNPPGFSGVPAGTGAGGESGPAPAPGIGSGPAGAPPSGPGFPGGGPPGPGASPGASGGGAPGMPGGPGVSEKLHPQRVSMAHVTDGTSNTIGVIEAGPTVVWTKPDDFDILPNTPLPAIQGPFANVLNVVMLDGSVLALKRRIPEPALRNLIQLDDGNIIDFRSLRASFPPETPEERQLLKKRADSLITNADKLIEQLKKQIAEAKDEGKIEELEEKLKTLNQMLQGARSAPSLPALGLKK